ncbi:hypothetical protein C8R43DRAFT_850939, partial [Mycena crocata]
CPPEAANWLRTVYKEVSGELSGKKLGGIFNALLGVFLELEKGYGYKNPLRGLPRMDRPTEADAWINGARGSRGGLIVNGAGPVILSVVVFEERWWKWWGSLQPAWRKKAVGRLGRFTRDEYPPQGNAADWETLRFPGQNGALTLVATLYWWGMMLE